LLNEGKGNKKKAKDNSLTYKVGVAGFFGLAANRARR
jgi:hypothetical protein